MLNDPEVARVLASRPEPAASGRPSLPLSEYDTHASLLADVIDRLGDVLAVLTAQAGGKPGHITPAPRPITGVERARKRLADEHHDALVAEVKAAMARWDDAHAGN